MVQVGIQTTHSKVMTTGCSLECCDLLHRSVYEKFVIKIKKTLDILDTKNDFIGK